MCSTLWRKIRPTQCGALVIWLTSSFTGIGISQIFDPVRLLLFFTGIFLALVAGRLFEDHIRIKDKTLEGTAHTFHWFTIVLGVMVLILAFFIYFYGLIFLIPLGVAAFIFVILPPLANYRLGSRLAGEQVGILGLTLTAPVGYYIITGRVDLNAWMMWLILLLYHIPTHSHIRALLSKVKTEFVDRKTDLTEPDKGEVNTYRSSIYRHIISLGVLIFLAGMHLVPQLTILAFSVFLIRLVKVGKKTTYISTVSRVGIRESILLVVFSVVIIISYQF